MTKRQLIDEIVAMNQTAEPSFLARFDDAELSEYLTHLNRSRMPRLTGDARKYEKYFLNCPTIGSESPAKRTVRTNTPMESPSPISVTPDDHEEGILPEERRALTSIQTEAEQETTIEEPHASIHEVEPLFEEESAPADENRPVKTEISRPVCRENTVFEAEEVIEASEEDSGEIAEEPLEEYEIDMDESFETSEETAVVEEPSHSEETAPAAVSGWNANVRNDSPFAARKDEPESWLF
jgi:hypothetical protein